MIHISGMILNEKEILCICEIQDAYRAAGCRPNYKVVFKDGPDLVITQDQYLELVKIFDP